MLRITRLAVAAAMLAGITACTAMEEEIGTCDEGVSQISQIGDITPAGC